MNELNFSRLVPFIRGVLDETVPLTHGPYSLLCLIYFFASILCPLKLQTIKIMNYVLIILITFLYLQNEIYFQKSMFFVSLPLEPCDSTS